VTRLRPIGAFGAMRVLTLEQIDEALAAQRMRA
jgi:hypothetical protein